MSFKTQCREMSKTTGLVLNSYDQQGERSMAVAQAIIALFVLLFHVISSLKSDLSFGNPLTITILGSLILSSYFRVFLASRDILPEKTLLALGIFDVVLFLFLIWSYQYAYALPAGSILKSPSYFLLFAIVATRSLRFHPYPIIATGCSAVLGSLLLVLAAVWIDGNAMLTSSYAEFLMTTKILIGAEIEKVFALTAFTACLAFGAWWARGLLLQIDSVVEHLPQGVALVDKQRRLAVFNSMFRRLYRIKEDDIRIGTSIEDFDGPLQLINPLSAANDTPNLHWAIGTESDIASTVHQTEDGQIYSIRRKNMPDGSVVSTTEDVTEIQRIQHLAFHDPLTSLANRRKLDGALETLQEKEAVSGAILCLDLDNFKPVNDIHGHQIGDLLLVHVAKRLRACVRQDDLIARVGGDEFIILIEATQPDRIAERVAGELLASICRPFDLEGCRIQIGASIGIRVFEGALTSPQEYIDEADKALYLAKEKGKNQFRFAEAA